MNIKIMIFLLPISIQSLHLIINMMLINKKKLLPPLINKLLKYSPGWKGIILPINNNLKPGIFNTPKIPELHSC